MYVKSDEGLEWGISEISLEILERFHIRSSNQDET